MAEWVALCPIDVLRPRAIVDATVGDEDVVVWRGDDGTACVMEARCPHQWSHLGAEGVVDGNEIVCATHYWRFDREGAGWKESMTGRRDRKGDIAVFRCAERDGYVWAELPEGSPA